MATRKFHLSEEAVDDLKRAEKATRKASELRRVPAVRLHGSGETVKQIVEVTRVGTRSLLGCVTRYQHKGSRTLLTEEQRRDLAVEQRYGVVGVGVLLIGLLAGVFGLLPPASAIAAK